MDAVPDVADSLVGGPIACVGPFGDGTFPVPAPPLSPVIFWPSGLDHGPGTGVVSSHASIAAPGIADDPGPANQSPEHPSLLSPPKIPKTRRVLSQCSNRWTLVNPVASPGAFTLGLRPPTTMEALLRQAKKVSANI